MRIARLFLWVLALLLFVGFAIPNWTPVPMLFGAKEVVVRLPALLLAALLAGFLPPYIALRLARRRQQLRRLETAPLSALTPGPPVGRPEQR